MSDESKFEKFVEMVIPMQPNEELQVIQKAEELALKVGFDPDRIDEIKLALIEAVINAIEHGNNAEGKVYVVFEMGKKPRRLSVTISDSGSGFDPAAVKAPDIREKMHKKSRKRGWGLKIMRSLMDEVRFESSSTGTRVTLVKNG